MSPLSIALASLVVFGGFAIRGVTGFGSILFTLPLLVLWLPVKQVVPLLAVLSLANGAWLAWRARSRADLREFGWLMAGGVPGVAAGLLLFHSSPDRALRQALGGCIALVGIWLYRRGGVSEKEWPRPAGLGAGLVSGVLGGLFGLSGPPPVVYLSARPLAADQFRATLLLFLLAVDLARGAGYAVYGAADATLWLTGLALLPASVLGSWCGERLHQRLPEDTFRRLTAALLVVMGLVLVVNT